MLQIFIGIVVASLIWRSVGATLAAKGHHHPVGYQFLAVAAFLVGGVGGALAASVLADPRSDTSFVVVLIVSFAVPLIGGGAGAGTVLWWISGLPATATAAKRAKESADYNPFDETKG